MKYRVEFEEGGFMFAEMNPKYVEVGDALYVDGGFGFDVTCLTISVLTLVEE